MKKKIQSAVPTCGENKCLVKIELLKHQNVDIVSQVLLGVYKNAT